MKYLAILAAIWATGADAQTVIDGSGKDVSKAILNRVLDFAANHSKDPRATQFRRIHLDNEHRGEICGQFNVKNASGAYEGFAVFNYSKIADNLITWGTNARDSAAARLAISHAAAFGCATAAGITDPAEIRRIKDALKKAAN